LQAVTDTNFVIAVMFKDRENHRMALKKWSNLEKAYLPIISITELAYYLVKNKMDLGIIEEVLNDPKIEVVPVTLEDVYYALGNKDEVRGYDDVNDFLILSISLRLNLQLLTFDKKLKRKMQRRP
jgi:predicted nucleic acid-binding protein